MEDISYGTRSVMGKKRIFIKILIVLLVLVVICASYVFYFYKSYKREPDETYLETGITGAYSYFQDDEAINTQRAYNFLTYNIGFGAYTPEYSFFMDGGKYSWAFSEEELMANMCEITDVINNTGADFVLLQEVDTDGTRTYHINELELLNQFLKGFYVSNAIEFDSSFIFFPPWQPHGKNQSVLVTYSKGRIASSIRRSLPISEGFMKVIDYDRCYMVNKIPTANEKNLCIYNVHLSAYTNDEELKRAQIQKLFDDMAFEYKNGNYVICGGDFNQNLRAIADDNAPDWALPFPRDMIPNGFRLAIDEAKPENVVHDTTRNADEPYNPDTTFTVTTDGFIVSDNVNVNFYINTDSGYKYSDHDPVFMQVILKD